MNTIFLSAQPDDYYFLWQLKLQLYNFKLHNINPKSIHILIGYDSDKGLLQGFADLINGNPEVNIHAYPDSRINKSYSSSIRPHIISKHLDAFPELQEATIFYHDSDIVFKGLPDFSQLITDDVWYTSDTGSYLNCNYIRNTAGGGVFQEMCQIVGVSTHLVETNDLNAGGAQYLLKKTTTEFWNKVENDCVKMYSLLINNNNKAGFCNNNQVLIQAWCADMWVVWWNALFYRQKFQIHAQLSFVWANSSIEQFDKCKILHYTGSKEKGNPRFFRKYDYVHYDPFYADLSEIDPNLCSIYVKELIEGYVQVQRLKRADLSDVSFLIMARIDSAERLENTYISIMNLSIYYNTNIILTEIDNVPKIDRSKLPAEVQYSFIKDDDQRLLQTKYINQMILNASTPYIAIYDTDAVLPVNQILESVAALRSGSFSVASPYNGNFLSVDQLIKAIFNKIQDVAFLEENQNKLIAASKRSFGGAVFLNRVHYCEAGLENENLTFWGPNDIERIRRLLILGYKIKRIKGNLYHLCHPRGPNSGYQSKNEQNIFLDEYLKVSKMQKVELQNYVDSWQWKPQIINELDK
ncbi:galactosyltransferase-related protein [Mucilaginibacter sp. X5P1]|uniref:galactosyltransferase-related protein n=1 Tax=Mucilaginibacter sp. X5P1 TaxID=2723088 RepID=UPI00161752AF|nr:galactosyltransferase-related protein [Mucilaginibacter sp. X5P1]MBB6138283.1 hypothetical protein [Mucilaginibacter sp. X5P1]